MNQSSLSNPSAPAAMQYGKSASCDLPAEGVRRLTPTGVHPLPDLAQAVRMAWAAPLDFPSLSQATVPGDTAAIALSSRAPQADQLALGAVAALMDAGIEPQDIAVVSTYALEESFAQRLAELEATGVRQIIHDPEDVEACAMVGVMKDDSPLRLNRWIAEADLVLPIGVAEINAEDDRAASKFEALYPEFSDAESRQNFQKKKNKAIGRRASKLTELQDEAGWLLGVLSTLQVVAGSSEGVAAVFAGEAHSVAKAAYERCQESWQVAADDSADLVVAAVCGDQRHQTWTNASRALAAAERLVAPGGAILLCTELETPPRGAFRKLRNVDDLTKLQAQLQRDETESALPALRFAQALARGPVYLVSKLRPMEVESLGMTPVANDSEIARLVSRHEHCIAIDQAQRLVPKIEKSAHPSKKRNSSVK